jgi:HEAT repeat protein
MDALGDDASPFVRDAAAMALWQNADDERVADAFAHALADEDEDVRWSAAHGLAQRTA